MNILQNVVWGLIPARGGSKSIPMKNLTQFGGRPLIDFQVIAARGYGGLARLLCSTDHPQIADRCNELDVEVHHRPDELGDLRTGEHSLNTGHDLGRAGIERSNTSMRHVAAFKRHVLHVNNLYIVDVGTEALDQPRVFTSLDALPDQFRKYWRRSHDLPLIGGVLHRVDNVLVTGTAT